MSVWIMVLMLSGSGKAITVLPFEYPTLEACETAARDAGREMPDWVCVGGPKAVK